MRKLKIYAGITAMLALLLTGCGAKEGVAVGNESETVQGETPKDDKTEASSGNTASPEAPSGTEASSGTSSGSETTSPVPTWFLVEQEEQFIDYSVGTFVAGYNVLDFGADPTGNEDNTKIFQTLLNSLGDLGGGSLYVPQGMYRFNGFLRIPKGVTLRGDWKEPEEGKPIEGTVLMAYAGKGLTNEDLPFITLVLGSGVMDVAIWYPEQDPLDIQPYSPAITMGQQGYFGNEYNNVKNVTLVNAYDGVHFSYTNSGACPIINGVYGTVLKTGVEIDDIGDVGRIERVKLSPSYWLSSGLYERIGLKDPFSDAKAEEALKDYLYQNATGICMRRNDWSYTCYVDVDGYQYGYRAMKSAVKDSESMPNGHQYGMKFTNCQTGISISASANAGFMFAYLDIQDCENGFVIESSASGPVQVQAAKISANNQAVAIENMSSALLQMNGCTIEKGKVTVDGGVLDLADSDLLNATDEIPHVFIGLSGRVNMVGNRYNGERKIANKSLYASNISDEDAHMDKLPEYVEVVPQVKLPASMTLYVVTDYGAVADGKTDCTDAVRNALKDAAKTGGIVFFPPGYFRFDDTLTVPTGVELRGACDNSTLPHGEGTILEVYCGEGDVDAEPFLQLKEGSGIRGLTINYPNQIYTGTKEVEPDYEPIPYPYTIQGQGKDIYIINVGVRASYMGVDMFTYPCDDHYIDFFTGQMFRVGLRISNCKEGILQNMQCNTICYAYGHESKFGSFPNSPAKGVSNQPVYDYAFYNLDNLILGDCENELLYNDFNFGAYRGILFVNDGKGGVKNGFSIGLGLDKDCQGFYFGEGLDGADFTFINTQVVSTQANVETEYVYAEADSDFNMLAFGGDFWGNPQHFIKMGDNSGRFVLQNARINHPGRSTFAVMSGGDFSLSMATGGTVVKIADVTKDAKLAVRACIMDDKGAINGTYIWENNLPSSAIFADVGETDLFLDRKGWTADASHNAGNAARALDGDPATRWDTSALQAPGQWFVVDMGTEIDFNGLLLDISGSPGDAPKEYEIFVSSDGEDWGGLIASGQKASGMIPLEPQHARYLKITQNGSGGGYWSIHELYLLNLE